MAGLLVEGNGLPLVEEIRPNLGPCEVFLRMASLPHCIFLDSAAHEPSLGRYSFVAADPFEFLRFPADATDALAVLAERLRAVSAERAPGLPPFQGGAAGLLGYELGRSLERIPAARCDAFATPAMAVGLYDVVVAFDHVERRAWIISQGLPELEPGRRKSRAAERLAQVRRWIERPADTGLFSCTPRQTIASEKLATQYATEHATGVTSNFSKQGYLDAVRRVVEYIRAGDVFQVNLAQRLLMPAREDSVSLYQRLRRKNPAVMAGYFDLGDMQILSASPERFFSVHEGLVETRPIKGTRPRTGDADRDRAAAEELLTSEKDRAENVMIVDLMRNDLGRVCELGSIHVSQLCEIESCAYVLHLVSAVQGRLPAGRTAVDLLRAAFPGGSITGAPKIRAMEIIAELEPTARGAYCGSLGYLGFDGTADWNILIRTITAAGGWWQFPVGGGIVADSTPDREYAETWHKAEGLLRAIGFERPY